MRLLSFSVLFGCAPGNDLPGPGDCELDDIAGIDPPVAEPIALGAPASFDDLHYADALDRVLAVPLGQGTLWLVEPRTGEVTSFAGLPDGSSSADATASHVYVGDRGGRRVVVLDAEHGDVVQLFDLAARPDYVRLAPEHDELWVTQPGADAIEVLAIADDGTLSSVASIATEGGPEGLAFDEAGELAYVHRFAGPLVQIDVAQRKVLATWDTGCASAHGFPQIDRARGLAFAGCSAGGGAAVLDATDGRSLAGFEAGGGDAILAYAPMLGHFYLRGDPDGDLAMLAVCDSGELTELATVDISAAGHGMTADRHGNVWVCDATTGGLLRVRDPYPAL